MKTLMLGGCIAAFASLHGCAPAPTTPADVDGRIVCNADRMSQAELDARRKITDVHWVHCPQTTLRATDS